MGKPKKRPDVRLQPRLGVSVEGAIDPAQLPVARPVGDSTRPDRDELIWDRRECPLDDRALAVYLDMATSGHISNLRRDQALMMLRECDHNLGAALVRGLYQPRYRSPAFDEERITLSSIEHWGPNGMPMPPARPTRADLVPRRVLNAGSTPLNDKAATGKRVRASPCLTEDAKPRKISCGNNLAIAMVGYGQKREQEESFGRIRVNRSPMYEGEAAMAGVDVPARKRGRPRKDESLQAAVATPRRAMVAYDQIKKEQEEAFDLIRVNRSMSRQRQSPVSDDEVDMAGVDVPKRKRGRPRKDQSLQAAVATPRRAISQAPRSFSVSTKENEATQRALRSRSVAPEKAMTRKISCGNNLAIAMVGYDQIKQEPESPERSPLRGLALNGNYRSMSRPRQSPVPDDESDMAVVVVPIRKRGRPRKNQIPLVALPSALVTPRPSASQGSSKENEQRGLRSRSVAAEQVKPRKISCGNNLAIAMVGFDQDPLI